MRVEDVPVGRFRGLDGSRRVWSEAYHESLNLSAFDRRGRPGAAPIGCMTCLGHGRRLIDRPRRSTDVRSSSHNRCGSSAPPSLSPSFLLRRPRPPPPPLPTPWRYAHCGVSTANFDPPQVHYALIFSSCLLVWSRYKNGRKTTVIKSNALPLRMEAECRKTTKKRWIDNIKDDVADLGLNIRTAKDSARDRKRCLLVM